MEALAATLRTDLQTTDAYAIHAGGAENIARILDEANCTDVVVLGPAGSNSHVVAEDIRAAAQHLAGNGAGRHRKYPTAVFVEDMEGVFDGLSDDRVALVPVVNSIGGEVQYGSGTTLQEINRRGLRILGWIACELDYNLYAPLGADVSNLAGRYVYTHVQAQLQCSDIIARESMIAAGATSTSAAAELLASGKLGPGSLAIATPLAGTLYKNLQTVAQHVGNVSPSPNITTMAVVALQSFGCNA